MPMTQFGQELLLANERYAAAFGEGDLPAPPARNVAVVTCMDARIDPIRALGLKLGEAHIIRNAGGRATDDAVRSLIVSQQMLGTREIIVIHHTECGMMNLSNDDVRSRLRDRCAADAEEIDFLVFDDLEDSVRADVAALRESPLIPDDIVITGFVYNIRTGRLLEVETSSIQPASNGVVQYADGSLAEATSGVATDRVRH
jgi:carbonic anhydrase